MKSNDLVQIVDAVILNQYSHIDIAIFFDK